MNFWGHPIRTTLVYGFICGIVFVPLTLGLTFLMPRPQALALTLWVYTAVYGILLCRLAGKRVGSILFPLLLLLGAVFFTSSPIVYVMVALLILSWIRSGICFHRSLRGLLAELVIGMGGGALLSCFLPGTALTWSLGIWMFFLVQALYFAFFENPKLMKKKGTPTVDAFERARRMAEEILS